MINLICQIIISLSLQNLGKAKEALDIFDSVAGATDDIKQLDGVTDALKAIMSGIGFDDAFNVFRKLGVEGDDLRDILDALDFEIVDIDKKLAEVGSSGTKSVKNLGEAFSGLAAKIGISTKALAGISIGLAAIPIITAIVKAVKEAEEERARVAKENAEEYASSVKAIGQYRAETESLIESINSNKLSSDELYNARARLVEIEGELVDSYGTERGEMDLLTASVEEAAAAYDDLEKKKANAFLNENSVEVYEAIRRMQSEYTEQIGSFRWDMLSSNAKEVLKELSESYDAIRISDSSVGTNFKDIEIVASDATSATEALNAFGDAVRSLSAEDFDLLSSARFKSISDRRGVMDVISQAIGDVNEIIDKYGTHAAEGINATIKASDEYSKAYDALVSAEQAYSDAVNSNYDTPIDRANAVSEAYANIVDSLNIFSSTEFDDSKVTDKAAKDYMEGMGDSLKGALSNLDLELDIADALFKGYSGNDFKAVADDLSSVILRVYSSNITDILNFGLGSEDWDVSNLTPAQEAYMRLEESAHSYGMELKDLLSIMVDYDILTASNASHMADATRAYTSVTGEIESVKKILTEQSEVGSISLESYESLIAISSEYADLLKNESDILKDEGEGLRINTAAVSEITKRRAEDKLAIIETGKALAKIRKEEIDKELEKIGTDLSKLTKEQKLNKDSLEAEREELNNNINKYNLMAAAIKEASSARQGWLNAQGMSEPGDSLEDVSSAYAHIHEVLNGTTATRGDIGTEKFRAAMEYIVPLAEILGDEVKLTTETIVDNMPKIKQYQNVFKELFKIDGNGSISDIRLDNIIKKLSSGSDAILELGSDNNWLVKQDATLESFAEKLGVTEEVARTIIGMMNRNGWSIEIEDNDVPDNLTDISTRAEEALNALKKLDSFETYDIELDTSNLETTEEKVSRLTKTIHEAQRFKARPEVDASEIEYANSIILAAVQNKKLLEYQSFISIDTSQIDGSLGQAMSLLQEFLDKKTALEAQIAMNADASDVEAAREELDKVLESLKNIDESAANALGEFGFDLSNVNVDTVNACINNINTAGVEKIKAAFDIEKPSEEDLQLNSTVRYTPDFSLIYGRRGPILHGTVYYSGSFPGNLNGTANLSGTANASGDWGVTQGGRALVGELGQEIVVDPQSGRWHTVGDNGAEFTYIPRGAIVFNHIQTKHLLENGHVTGRGRALASGTAAANISGGGPDLSHFTSGLGTTSASTKKMEGGFDKEYARHQHLVAMEKEALRAYIDWLEKAYKDAYKNGAIELEDYYKYEEEVYEGRKELLEDYLSDYEHQIERLSREDGNEAKIINIYLGMIESVKNQIKEAKEYGLTENDDYIQELTSKIYDYEDEIADIREESTDNAKDAVKDLVDYRVDMLKQELEDERDALNDRLSDLKDFYDKQKELLQDEYDEEEYLEEQHEKRKAKSDIEAELARLSRDNSAWAQKRRLELQEELAEAEKDLADFEKDKALEDAMDMLDKLYEKQESGIQTQIDEIEDRLNDPKALYNQALKDIQNNTLALYEEMVEYNDKHGSGNSEDIKEMWDEARESLEKYLATYGEAYKGITLVPSPGGYAGGTSNASPGAREVDELGAEYLFTSKDGKRYRVFSGGEKMLNAKATNFLYNFATSGGRMFTGLFDRLTKAPIHGNIDTSKRTTEISLGDIIIQGNANENTVSEIRREKRSEMQWILKEFNKMNKRS